MFSESFLSRATYRGSSEKDILFIFINTFSTYLKIYFSPSDVQDAALKLPRKLSVYPFWLMVIGGIWELGGRHVHGGDCPPVNPSHPSGVQTARVSSHYVNVVLILEAKIL